MNKGVIIKSIVAIGVIVLIFFGGKRGLKELNSYRQGEIDALRDSLNTSKESYKELQQIVEESQFRQADFKELETILNNEINREKIRRIRAEKQLKDIYNRRYDRKYLDSLKESVRFQ